MSRVVPAAKQLAVGMAAATVLSLGVGGLAGAATAAPSSTPAPATTPTTPATHRHFNCARGPRVLARIQKIDARIKAGLPKLQAAEQKAKTAGHTKAAARIERRISRLERPKTTARLDRLSAAIETKCGVSAPTASSSTGTAPAPTTTTTTT
jgi:hypothetical protein